MDVDKCYLESHRSLTSCISNTVLCLGMTSVVWQVGTVSEENIQGDFLFCSMTNKWKIDKLS